MPPNPLEMDMSSLICKRCGMPIRSTYIDAAGGLWHPEHFVCSICGKPIHHSQFTLAENRPCHTSCYLTQVALKCSCCDKVLIGHYNVDFWNNNYCPDCVARCTSCRYCGRLICKPPNATVGAATDLRSCTVCRGSALHSLRDASILVSVDDRLAEAKGSAAAMELYRTRT